jgi:hypothetical protein
LKRGGLPLGEPDTWAEDLATDKATRAKPGEGAPAKGRKRKAKRKTKAKPKKAPKKAPAARARAAPGARGGGGGARGGGVGASVFGTFQMRT